MTSSPPQRAPARIELTEVGLRDGLQNETRVLSTEHKLELLHGLHRAGLRRFELTSFVSPRAVPALADAAELVAAAKGLTDARFSALVPNLRGAERALEVGIDRVVLFVSASETHNARNVNRSIDASLAGFADIVERLSGSGIEVQGAIATAFGCPFEGDLPAGRIGELARRLGELGIDDLTLGDTTGMATPAVVSRVVGEIAEQAPAARPILHFHNTRGLALANVMQGLSLGVTRYESAVGGLGGCPFAPGASGNLATEELIYLLEELGHDTGVSLESLIEVAGLAARRLERAPGSQLARAGTRLRLHRPDAVPTAKG
ncbi:hydroxymethylglutaryl-CoA lyase [Halomonas litopenaei]|nr:hydroxymethylglutaryl-CoA lyase [Halomonas litopenaei]